MNRNQIRILLFAMAACAAVLSAQQQPIRITAGGARQNYVAADGTEWLTDRYYSLGGTVYFSGPIANTADSYLYQTGRAGLYTDFSYNIPVANGAYSLKLKFAELQQKERGQRQFSVVVNGAKVLENFDILAEVPIKTALDKQFPINVTDGKVNIEFVAGTGRGTVSAIELTPAGGATPAPAPAAAPAPATPASQPAPAAPQAAPNSDIPAPTSGQQWHVSPNGTAGGNGSAGAPWDLATALKGPASVAPGDTIWLHGGAYGDGKTVFESRLKGSASKPIVVRQYPGERATVNGGIATYSPYTWYWGFEITNTNPNRGAERAAPECIDTYDGSTGVKLINLVLHDCAQGVGFWVYSPDSEAYGNLIYYNGWQGGGTDRGHGHGIYVQNKDGAKLLADNIIFDQFGLGIQAYGSSNAYVQNYTIDGNIIFNNGTLSDGAVNVDNILVAVGSGAKNIKVTNNYTYHTPSENDGYSRLGWSWSPTNQDIVATGNYWIGGESAIEMWNWSRAQFTGNTAYSQGSITMNLGHQSGQSTSNYIWDNNTYYGSGKFRYRDASQSWSSWKANTKVDANSTYTAGRPKGVWKFVRPNKYEEGRANIAIYNWDGLAAVPVDVSSVVKIGAQYEVRDAQNFFGAPVLTGTYAGGTISIPMSGLKPAAAVGAVRAQPVHTAPEFGTFVILSR